MAGLVDDQYLTMQVQQFIERRIAAHGSHRYHILIILVTFSVPVLSKIRTTGGGQAALERRYGFGAAAAVVSSDDRRWLGPARCSISSRVAVAGSRYPAPTSSRGAMTISR